MKVTKVEATTHRVPAGETLFRDPPKPVRGTDTLSDRPGLGLEPNEDALRETRER